MAIERIRWKLAGFRTLRKSRPVVSDLINRGQKVASAAGAGFKMTPFAGKNRARVSIITDTPEAMRDNQERQSLLRALDAGR